MTDTVHIEKSEDGKFWHIITDWKSGNNHNFLVLNQTQFFELRDQINRVQQETDRFSDQVQDYVV